MAVAVTAVRHSHPQYSWMSLPACVVGVGVGIEVQALVGNGGRVAGLGVEIHDCGLVVYVLCMKMVR